MFFNLWLLIILNFVITKSVLIIFAKEEQKDHKGPFKNYVIEKLTIFESPPPLPSLSLFVTGPELREEWEHGGMRRLLP